MAKADIYTDGKNRRRVDRDLSHIEAPTASPEKMQAQLTALQKELAALKAEFAGLTIAHKWFSGSGKGLKFNPPDPTVTAVVNCDTDPPTVTVTVQWT